MFRNFLLLKLCRFDVFSGMGEGEVLLLETNYIG